MIAYKCRMVLAYTYSDAGSLSRSGVRQGEHLALTLDRGSVSRSMLECRPDDAR